ncbi:hypothetical protein [Streptococcus saliviloxodontae]|uniref:XRE family transcriptional regulator n=1 Tax=Streptococcus saliviloxodontae TaxID=1349416 RepID=A0ABS2PLL8_9STRE|nr:hypothetical protein [Streptococcus saliviloxodontae]MBM7636162.1 hypothetical protein [Streptococcus saliviloxodontae]
MSKKNELLEQDILEKIDKARYEKPEKEKNRHSIFYLVVVTLVTLAVVYSLVRYLR